MAQFTGKKIDITKINGGQEITDGSGVTPELLNAPVNSALYTEKAIDILTSQVDTSEIDGTGTPSVSFVETINGQETYKYLKLKNLKGAKGEQGKEGKQGRSVKKLVQSGADLIVEYDDGTSQTMVGAIQALTELPIVSVDDFGKILVVNQDGKWAVGDAPEGGGGKNIQSIVIEGTSFIVTYIDGSVETVEIDTQNTVVATPEEVAGGGITDVQVAGTSVVTDGVANIPEASVTQAGVVTTGPQTFMGVKNFTSNQINVGSGNTQFKILTETSGLTFQRTSTQSVIYKFKGKSNINSVYVSIDPTGKMTFVDANATHKIAMQSGLLTSTTSTLPAYSGTLMSAPETWTTGTSGTATLPSAGLYEIYFVKDTVTYSTIVRWANDWVQTICGVRDLQQGTEVYILDIGQTGFIDLFEKNMADGGSGGASATTIYFRKIGIA